MKALTMMVSLALAAGAAWAQDAKGAPARQDPKPQQTPEQEAAEAQKRALEALAGRQEVKVTIEVRNVTVAAVIQQFREQVPYVNFDLVATAWPDDYRVAEFVVKNEPWRSALAAFIAKVEGQADEESPTLIRITRPPRVTFAFKNAPITTVIDLIARMSGANIIVHPDVQGSVTMSVNNVPWNAVLDAVVKTVGDNITVKEKYDIIRVLPQRELVNQMETQFFPLKFIQPPPNYRAQAEGTRFFVGRPIPPASTVQEQLQQFTLLEMLRGLLTRGAGGGAPIGVIQYDPNTNTITVRDTKNVLNRISEVLKVLDAEPAQVMIDVKFISTTNEDLLNFGVNWSFQQDEGVGIDTRVIAPTTITAASGPLVEGPFTRSGTGKVTRLPFGFGREFSPADQFFLTNYDMVATFRAFKKDKYSKLLQGPHISVLDNTEATIFVGEQVPYAEARATANQFGGLEFTISEGARSPVRVGFQLLVIPRIVPESNKVILTIIPINEFLSGSGTGQGLVPGFERFTIPGAGQNGATVSIDLPRIASTTLVTRLMLESGRTAVIGGLVNERVSYEDKKVPFLGDLPVVGYFFKSRADNIKREHLLIFVTPRIIRSVTQQEESLKALLKDDAERARKEYEAARKAAEVDRLKKEDAERAKEKAGEVPK